jgi:hypothetical protein
MDLEVERLECLNLSVLMFSSLVACTIHFGGITAAGGLSMRRGERTRHRDARGLAL